MIKTQLKTQLKRHWGALKQRFSFPYLQAQTPNFFGLFSKRVKIQRVATGFQFTEGPIWLSKKGVLLFSDIPANKIYQFTPSGTVSIYREPSGYSNGLTCDHQGRLIVCEHGNRRVTRTELDGTITVLADSFEGKPLNSPNDVVVGLDGSIYFTDPPYGIQPDQQVQPVQGVYRIANGDGTLTRLIDDFECPNGLAFSQDYQKLYIDDSSERRHVRVFGVQSDGSLVGGQIFCDMNIGIAGYPDGMKFDSSGYLFCTGPGGVWVLDPQGNHLGTIVLPEQPANCAWGDDDDRSLYITAETSVYRVRCRYPGAADIRSSSLNV